MVNKESDSNYSWLKNVPPYDFKHRLDKASEEEIQAVLDDLTAEGNVEGNKTRRKILEARLRKLRRKNA